MCIAFISRFVFVLCVHILKCNVCMSALYSAVTHTLFFRPLKCKAIIDGLIKHIIYLALFFCLLFKGFDI